MWFIMCTNSINSKNTVEKDKAGLNVRVTVHLWLVNKCETNQMQLLVILLLISCSSTCFGRLYAHRQEVRLRFHCIWLSVLCALCGVATYSTQCTQLASRLFNITTVTTGQMNICSGNTVWPPEDGRKDARNMLRNNWLTIKSLIAASVGLTFICKVGIHDNKYVCTSTLNCSLNLTVLFMLLLDRVSIAWLTQVHTLWENIYYYFTKDRG